MKLLAYLINGQKVGIDIPSWNTSDLSGNSAFKFAETIEAGYGDITSIDNLNSIGADLDKDYKYVRNEIFTQAWTKMSGDPSNWGVLTESEQEISARWFVVPKELRDTVYTTEEQIPFAEIFDSNSIGARGIRFNKAKYEIYNRLTISQANTILNEIESSVSTTTPNLRESYINYGREGTSQGDPEGLYDYINAVSGTSFYGQGFITHDYIPVGYSSMTEFAETKIMPIIKDGLY